MRTKPVISLVACIALSACLAIGFAAPAVAAEAGAPGMSCAQAAASGAQTLTVGSLTTQEAASTPKPKAVTSVKLTSPKYGKATVSWKASKVEGLTNQTYTVRWSYSKAMKNAKTKTVKAKKAPLICGTPADHFVPSVSLSIVGDTSKKGAANINAVRIRCRSSAYWTDYSGYYAVWYSYSKSMKDATCVILSRKGEYPSGSITLKNLKKGKTLYVQAQNCCIMKASYDSDLSDIVSIKIPSKWVKAKGHYEPVYTTVVDQEAYTTYTTTDYCACGYSSNDAEEFRNHRKNHAINGEESLNSWTEDIEEYHPAITHREQTGKRWVVDVPGHWE